MSPLTLGILTLATLGLGGAFGALVVLHFLRHLRVGASEPRPPVRGSGAEAHLLRLVSELRVQLACARAEGGRLAEVDFGDLEEHLARIVDLTTDGPDPVEAAPVVVIEPSDADAELEALAVSLAEDEEEPSVATDEPVAEEPAAPVAAPAASAPEPSGTSRSETWSHEVEASADRAATADPLTRADAAEETVSDAVEHEGFEFADLDAEESGGVQDVEDVASETLAEDPDTIAAGVVADEAPDLEPAFDAALVEDEAEAETEVDAPPPLASDDQGDLDDADLAALLNDEPESTETVLVDDDALRQDDDEVAAAHAAPSDDDDVREEVAVADIASGALDDEGSERGDLDGTYEARDVEAPAAALPDEVVVDAIDDASRTADVAVAAEDDRDTLPASDATEPPEEPAHDDAIGAERRAAAAQRREDMDLVKSLVARLRTPQADRAQREHDVAALQDALARLRG
ncbi:MAG: hypothetical protein R3F34_01260 [Planctomycetota bacterium]